MGLGPTTSSLSSHTITRKYKNSPKYSEIPDRTYQGSDSKCEASIGVYEEMGKEEETQYRSFVRIIQEIEYEGFPL